MSEILFSSIVTRKGHILFDKTALIIVDMINDFANKEGSLFVEDSIRTIQPIKEMADFILQCNGNVFFVNDLHKPNDKEFEKWPPHGVENTKGALIVDGLNLDPWNPLTSSIQNNKYGLNCIVLPKSTYDAFQNTQLEYFLNRMNIENLIIVGTVSNICILSTIHSAFFKDYNITIINDCISSLTEEGMNVLQYQAKNVYGCSIFQTVDDFRSSL